MDFEPGTVVREPDGPRAAMKMGPSVTAGRWFVMHPDHGGHYTDGKREDIDNWHVLGTE